MRVVVENIDGYRKEFTDERTMIETMQNIFDENEKDSEVELKRPGTLPEAIFYLKEYCGNLEIVE